MILAECLEMLEVEYGSYRGVCSDGCCGGLFTGYEKHVFEKGVTYEFDGDGDSVQLLYHREDTDRVWVHILDFEDHFRRVE